MVRNVNRAVWTALCLANFAVYDATVELQTVHDGVWTYENVATATEMEELMHAAFPEMSAQSYVTPTGLSAEVKLHHTEAISALTGRVLALFPTLKPPHSIRVRRYLSGEAGGARNEAIQSGVQLIDGSDWHSEHTDSWDSWYADGHGAIISALLYMNDNDEGSTRFEELGVDVVPRAGRMSMWRTCRNATHVEPRSIHKAMPLSRGLKWTALWLFSDDPRKVCGDPLPSPPQSFPGADGPSSTVKVPYGFEQPPGFARDPLYGVYHVCSKADEHAWSASYKKTCQERDEL